MSRKKKTIFTGDSIVNGISKKGLSLGNFPGRTSEKILEKLDDIIKVKPEDLELMISLIM